MPWFRLEDSFDTHPKVMAAGNEAIGLFTRCGTYAARHLTDGFVPEHIAVLYGAEEIRSRGDAAPDEAESLADTLVRVKLWRRTRGGWRMRDYLDYNPSREAVENDRKLKTERQKRWREKRGRRVTNPSVDASGDAAPPRPAPKEAGRAVPAPGASGGQLTQALAAAGIPPGHKPATPQTRTRLAAQARAALTQENPCP